MELTEQRTLPVSVCGYDAASRPCDPSEADGSCARAS